MNNTINTLLKSKWYINPTDVNGLVLMLVNMMNGKSFENPTPYVHYLSMENGIIAGSQLAKDNAKEYTALIPIKSTIYKFNQSCGPMGTRGYRSLLENYEKDVNCKGVVLDIDSGGGQVYGTPEFYDFIKGYSKPIVAYTDGYLCSAAYYIASACDWIVANKRADSIGSIGVMMSYVDVKGMLEKKGYKVIEEYASQSSEKNGGFRKLLSGTPEGISEYIEEELDPLAETFVNDMKSVRTISEDAFKGATYNADKSLEKGLIDQIGILADAFDKIHSLNNNSNTKTNMSNKIDAPQIASLLGDAFATANTENGIVLNSALAETINSALQNLATAQSDLATTKQDLATEKESITAINAAIKQALTEADVEVAENMSAVDGVTKLSALVSEYGSLGGSPTTIIKGTDESVANTTVVGGIDIADALNN